MGEVSFEYLRKFRQRYPNRKLYSLIDKVYSLKTLEAAWDSVYKNKGCAGIDKVTVWHFKARKEQYLRELHRALRTGTYTPVPVLRKYIPKKDGKQRPLGIPTVKDRVVQQALRMVLEPVFDAIFLDCSYGYRKGRSAHQAIDKLRYYRTKKHQRWVLDGDIKGFFDNVDHDILIGLVAKEIGDGRILELISMMLKAGVLEEGKQKRSILGTPQGGVISPLLANIYLHELDKYMTTRTGKGLKGYRLIRYADDFLVITSAKHVAEKALCEVKKKLSELKLEVHPDKTRIIKKEEFSFLGFAFGGTTELGFPHGWKGRPKDEAIKSFKQRIKEFTRRRGTWSPEEAACHINWLIVGWGKYFVSGDIAELYRKLDRYIRIRMRIYLEKRISRYSNQRIPNYTLGQKYKLKSLYYGLTLHRQQPHSV